MRYGDDGVAGELLPDDALNQCVGYVVETIQVIADQYVYIKNAEIK